jgi:hypothetical protein
MYTGQGNKEQVSQDLKDRFLIFLLILLIKDGFVTDLLINRLFTYAYFVILPNVL